MFSRVHQREGSDASIRSMTSTPRSRNWLATPAPTSTAGVPQDVVAQADGTSAETSARICAGTS